MRTRTSEDYVTTIDLSSDSALREIQLIKNVVKIGNKRAAFCESRYFVRVRGRLGKNSPYAHLYAQGGPLHRGCAQDIKLEHSVRADVYVSKRSKAWRSV